jgi:CheY-like chemotaxis protein
MATLMIVDDDHTMVSLLKILLEMEGHRVVNAAQQEAIFSSLRADKPDLVLMDVFLPGVDGMAVLTQIRATPELANTRVVMTSGMDVSDQSKAAGANGFLLKPYTPEQLIAIIQENLGQDGPRDSRNQRGM